MKVRYENGEVSSVRNDLGRELVRAGIATLVENEPDGRCLPKPGDYKVPAPRWSVETVATHTGHVLAVVMRLGNSDPVLYAGSPKFINARREWQGGGRFVNGFGRRVPDETVKQYAQLWKEAEPQPVIEGQEEIRRMFSGVENQAMAADKVYFDDAVKSGNVPHRRY